GDDISVLREIRCWVFVTGFLTELLVRDVQWEPPVRAKLQELDLGPVEFCHRLPFLLDLLRGLNVPRRIMSCASCLRLCRSISRATFCCCWGVRVLSTRLLPLKSEKRTVRSVNCMYHVFECILRPI